MLYSCNTYTYTKTDTSKYKGKNRRTLCCSGTNTLISCSQFFDTRRETILKSLSYHTMLTTPKRSWSNLNFSASWSELDCLPPWPKVNSQLFFKIFKFSGPSLTDMTSFTLQLHFLFGVYYDNCDCHILCERA